MSCLVTVLVGKQTLWLQVWILPPTSMDPWYTQPVHARMHARKNFSQTNNQIQIFERKRSLPLSPPPFLSASLSLSLSWSSAAMCGVCACICVSTTVLDSLCGLLELRMNSNSVACSVWIAGRRFLAPAASQHFHLIQTGIYATLIINVHLK